MQEPNYRYRAVSDRPMERKSVDDGFPTSVLWGFNVAARHGRPRPRGRDGLLPARRARRDPDAAAHQPGHVPPGRVAERLLPAAHEGLPAEHRGRGDAHLHLRPAGRARAERHAGRRGAHRARAPLLREAPAAGRQLHAAQGGPARGLRRHRLHGLRAADRPGPDAALHRAPPHREAEPRRGAERARRADRLLPRPRHARARAQRAPRGRAHVEPGVHGRRASSTASGWRCCPTRPTPWTRATTWCSGCTARRAGGATATRSSIRAPARSSRATSRWARCASARTTSSARACSRRTRTATRTPRRSARWRCSASGSSPRTRSATRSGLAHNYISQRPEGQRRAVRHGLPAAGGHAPERTDPPGRDSYANEIGAWDKITIRYGYTDFPAGTDEDAALEQILQEGIRSGITFITDQDARPASSAHPNVHLWDNGANAAAELQRMMDVRRVALDRFGETAIKTRRAARDHRGGARAALPLPPLPDAGRLEGDGRAVLHVRDARRRAAAAARGARGRADARRSTRCCAPCVPRS